MLALHNVVNLVQCVCKERYPFFTRPDIDKFIIVYSIIFNCELFDFLFYYVCYVMYKFNTVCSSYSGFNIHGTWTGVGGG